jgi:MFS family permease
MRPGRTTLIGASAAQATLSFVFLGLPAIGPQLRVHFGLSLAGLGALLAAMQLGSGVALIGAGIAVDRWGSRAATLVGTALATGGLAIGAAAASAPPLMAGLFLAGVGGAIVPVSGAGAIFRSYPVERRAWALGVRQMAVPLGGMIAAVTVPTLEAIGGPSLVLGVGASAVAVMGIGFAAVSDGERVIHPGGVHGLGGIWDGRRMGRLFAVTALYIVTLQAVLVYSVPAVRAAGFSAVAAGVTYFAVNVTAILSRVVWGRIADGGHGTRRTRTLVEVGVLASAGALVFGAALHGGFVIVVGAAVFYGFGALGWNAIVYAVAGEWARPTLAGRAFATTATVVFAVSALVNPAIGALAEWAGWDALWATVAVLGIAGTVIARTLGEGDAPVAAAAVADAEAPLPAGPA